MLITAAITFGDSFTPIKLLGLMISLIGIAGYNYVRIEKANSPRRQNLDLNELIERAEDLESSLVSSRHVELYQAIEEEET